MKIAVVTPYHTEPLDMLKRAHDSVMAQTHPCTHYMVADGHARAEINDWPVRHIALPVEHNNNGNTPRAIGSLDAIGDDFDAIAYLDADNWFDPDHIAGLVALHEETGADLVSSGRVIHAIDGSVLMHDGEVGDGDRHADTSALLVFESAFSVIPIWSLMPDELGPNCDRVFFQAALKLQLRHEHLNHTSMHFTSRYGPHYRAAGLPVPPDAVGMAGMKESEDFIRRMTAMGCKDVMSRRAVSAVQKSKLARPITIITLADETALGDDEKVVVDGLEAQLSHEAEFYFTTADELVSDSDVTVSRINVFVLVFESLVSDWQTVEHLIENRADLRLIYIRKSKVGRDTDITTTLDSRAMYVIVNDESLRDAYHQHHRYSAGHVVVANAMSNKVDTLSKAILAAAP